LTKNSIVEYATRVTSLLMFWNKGYEVRWLCNIVS